MPDRPLRICLVSLEYPPETAHGGIGSQTWTKARELTARGHDVHVLSSAAGPGEALRTEVHDGVTVHRLQPPDHQVPVYRPASFMVGYTWAVLAALAEVTREQPFDVLDFAEYGAEGYAYQLDRSPWNWMPVVVQLHGPLSMFGERIGWPETDSDFFRIGTAMEEESIRRADALMACSANIADFTAARHDVDREGIDVVHCGVDAAAFRPNGSHPDPEHPTVLFAGDFSHSKGAKVAFDAVMRLRSRYPGIRLRMLGKETDLSHELVMHARADGAGENVEVVGFVQDRDALARFYREADVFCSTADHEVGVANVYIEAMASGCPVVASTTGAAPEAVVDGESGLLVPPRDVDATAAAIDRIIGDGELRRRMSAGARAEVERYFAVERYADRVLATYARGMERSEERRMAALARAEEGDLS
jgi:glycosyltransferase involved in cell wall biosynthesis